MSRLLQEWLDRDVQLSRSVGGSSQTLGAAFSNGYLLGELLYRHNQQDDFDKFHDSDRVQKKVANFIRLERTLSRLNIKNFDARVALRMINGDDKTCFDILYKVKMALQKITVTVGRHRDEGLVPGSLVALTNLAQQTRKPAYEEATSDVFAKTLRQQITSQNQIDMEEHLQPFYDERARQDAYVEFCKREDQDMLAMYFSEIRRRRMMDKKAELEYLNDWNEKGIGIWTENQRRRKYINEVQARYEERVRLGQTSRAELAREESRDYTFREIADMEERVEAHQRDLAIVNGGDMSGDTSSDKVSGDGCLVDQQGYTNNCSEPKIKRRRQETQAEKETRDSRRSRFLDRLGIENENFLHDKRIELLQNSILRRSHAEEHLKGSLQKLEKFETVVRDNRKHREKMDNDQEALEESRFEERKLEYESNLEASAKSNIKWFSAQLEALRMSVHAAAHADAVQFCKGVVLELVELSLSQIELSRYEGVPTKLNERKVDEIVKFVEGSKDAADLYDYINDERTWGGIQRNSCSRLIGNLLIPLRTAALPPPPVQQPVVQRRFRLQLALVGPPYAHKTTMAVRLASRYSLRILQPEAFLRSYINKAEKLENGEPFTDEDYVEACVQAILKLEKEVALECALSEESASDGFTNNSVSSSSSAHVSFISSEDRVRQLFDRWDLDKSGDLDAQELLKATMQAHCEGKSQADIEAEALEAFAQMDFNMDGSISWEEFQQYFASVFGEHTQQVVLNLLHQSNQASRECQGWILDGFPFNKNQAYLLEARLSGKNADALEYQPPPALSLPCDSPRPLDKAQFQGANAGGLDQVFYLASSLESTFYKAAHASTNPLERFRVVPKIYVTERDIKDVQQWYDCFQIFQTINTSNIDPDSIFVALTHHVERTLTQKLSIEADEKAKADHLVHLAKCRRICDDWLSAVSHRRQEISSDTEGFGDAGRPLDSDNGEAPLPRIIDVPPLDLHSLKAAKVLPDHVMEENVDLSNPETFIGLLSMKVDACLAQATAYRETNSARARGIVESYASALASEGVEWDSVQLYEQFKIALPGDGEAPEDLDGTEQYQKAALETELQDNDAKADEVEAESLAAGAAAKAKRLNMEKAVVNLLWHAQRYQKQQDSIQQVSKDDLSNVGEETEGNSQEEKQVDKVTHLDPLTIVLNHLQAHTDERITAHRTVLLEQAKKSKPKGKDTPVKQTTQQDETTTSPPVVSQLKLNEINQALASKLIAGIDTSDTKFASGARELFAELREIRNYWVEYFTFERSSLDKKLRDVASEEERSELVQSFKTNLNSLAEDARYDPQTKAELHVRIEDLVQKLWLQSETRKTELLGSIEALEESQCVPTFMALVEDAFLQILQIEAVRFQEMHYYIIQTDRVLKGEDVGDELSGPSLVCISSIFRGIADEPPKGKNAVPEPRIPKAFNDARLILPAPEASTGGGDPPQEAESNELSEAIIQLRLRFHENVDRLERQLNESLYKLELIAKEQREGHRMRINERFDAEQVAVEAMVLYISTQVENSDILADSMTLEGVCFSAPK